MVLRAFFDESERRDGAEPLCVAGFVFKERDYKQFCRHWKRVLQFQGRRTSCFHMTDLYAGHGEYEGLTLESRSQILDYAVDAITQFAFAGVGVLFDGSEFTAKAPPEWPQYFGSIYSAACLFSFQAVTMWMTKRNCLLPIAYSFETGHKFRDEADRLMRGLASDEPARREMRYRRHSFEDKKTACGLQAADLFAWSITKAAVGGRVPAIRPFLPQLLRLAQSGDDRYQVHYVRGALLTAFIADNLAKGPGLLVKAGPRKRSLR